MTLKALFTEHPNSVNETYFEHMHMSSSFGSQLFLAMLCAFVHAVFPFLFGTTASGIIKGLYSRMVSNRVVKGISDLDGKTPFQLAFDSAAL